MGCLDPAPNALHWSACWPPIEPALQMSFSRLLLDRFAWKSLCSKELHEPSRISEVQSRSCGWVVSIQRQTHFIGPLAGGPLSQRFKCHFLDFYSIDLPGNRFDRRNYMSPLALARSSREVADGLSRSSAKRTSLVRLLAAH